MDEHYAASLRHGRHTLLGRRLVPFTLWHARELDHAGSPFAWNEGEIDFAELEIASLVCSTPVPRDPLRCWEPPRSHFLRRLFRLRRAARYAPARLVEIDRFHAYLADYSVGPHTYENNDGRPVETPWYLFYASRLMRFGGFSRHDAWATPVCAAKWENTAFSEIQGVELNLVTTADVEAMLRAGWTRADIGLN